MSKLPRTSSSTRPFPSPDDIITGTSGNDTLNGTARADQIDGGLGNDTINGLFGNDTIVGGGGNDRIDGGAGIDDLDGGPGIDTLTYASASDYTLVAAGWTVDLSLGTATNGFAVERVVNFEYVTGSIFNDRLIGSSVDNNFDGGAGDDYMDGGKGDDKFAGGSGNDLMIGGTGVDRFDGGSGNDTVSYRDEAGFILIDLGSRKSSNGSFEESIINTENAIGTAGDDTLTGDGLDNVLDGGLAGSDTINGAGGVDTVSYATSQTGVIIDLNVGSSFDGSKQDTFTSIENAIGSAFDDQIYGAIGRSQTMSGGTGGADTFLGGALFDTLSYAENARGVIVDLVVGASVDGTALDSFSSIEGVIGSAFDDIVFGSGAANTISGGSGNDRLQGEGGIDTLIGGAGNDLLIGGYLSDSLDGGEGIDTASYVDAETGVNVSLTTRLGNDGSGIDSLTGIENLVGSRFDDVLRGDSGSNVIDGGAGGSDRLDGATGFDTVTYAEATRNQLIDFILGVANDGVSVDTLQNFEAVIGSRFDDIIKGSEAADTIDGGPGGADDLDGRGGIDTLSYATATRGVIIDLSVGTSFDGASLDRFTAFEKAIGSSFDDQIFGSSANDSIVAGAGVDRLLGEGGVDTLDGGAGADMLNGGVGNDVFVMRRGELQGDVIEDFQGNGAAAGDIVQFFGYSPASFTVLVDAATSTYRITDGVDGFSETFRVIGSFDPPNDTVII